MIPSVLKENGPPQIPDPTYYKEQGAHQCISHAQQRGILVMCSAARRHIYSSGPLCWFCYFQFYFYSISLIFSDLFLHWESNLFWPFTVICFSTWSVSDWTLLHLSTDMLPALFVFWFQRCILHVCVHYYESQQNLFKWSIQRQTNMVKIPEVAS